MPGRVQQNRHRSAISDSPTTAIDPKRAAEKREAILFHGKLNSAKPECRSVHHNESWIRRKNRIT